MNALILCVGKLKEDWQRQGCAEYQKRLGRYGAIDVVEVADQAEPQKSSVALERLLLDKEGAELLRRMKPTDLVVALCIEGEAVDSMALSQRIADWKQSGRRVVLVIGGSLGLSEAVKARADVRLSFSKMTFPHGLMRVILLEQLYRAERILAGERYHK